MNALTNKLNINPNNLDDAYNKTLPHLKNINTKKDAQNVLNNLGIKPDFINTILPILKSEKAKMFANSFGINVNKLENQVKDLFNNDTPKNNNKVGNDDITKLKNNLKKLK